jgi:hypothetical protein
MVKEEYKVYLSKDNKGFYKSRYSHINKYFPEILEEIIKHISSNNLIPLNFNDAVCFYVNDIVIQLTCKVCNRPVHYGYQYCCIECKKKDYKTIINKTHETLLIRTGVKFPLSSKEAKEKRKKTCLKKYGVEHSSSNKAVRKKIKESNIKTYKNQYIRDKISVIQIRNNKEKKEEIVNKRKNTNFINHGEFTTLCKGTIERTKEILLKTYRTTNPFAIHGDTYQKAKLGNARFFENKQNKDNMILQRLNTINNRYGSWEKMCEFVFNKKKQKIINNIKQIGLTDEIIRYQYNKLGFAICKGKCGHEYETSLHLLRDRCLNNQTCCTICNVAKPIVSNGEKEIFNWLSSYIECEQSNRKVLNGSELDVYIPLKNYAIEYNGIYWHSDLFKEKDYHLNKTMLAKENNVNLIHVWEDLWLHKKDIVKGRILSKLNIKQDTIGARECYVKEVTCVESTQFLNDNHLQGSIYGYKYVALYNKENIVSLLVIGKRKLGKNNKSSYEILRFCNKLGIVCIGAFSKLFKYVRKKYEGNYISYSDLCWGEGNVYEKAGFKLNGYSPPNYWYFIENKRYHRYAFAKNNLVKMGYDSSKTEFKIMDEDVKALRVYDCGNAVWFYK